MIKKLYYVFLGALKYNLISLIPEIISNVQLVIYTSILKEKRHLKTQYEKHILYY